MLDIQPGRSDFFTRDDAAASAGCASPTSASRSTRSGACSAGEVPGQVIGTSTRARSTRPRPGSRSSWRATTCRRSSFVIHQFTEDMVDDTQLKPRTGLAMVLNADGFGTPAVKKSKYHAFTRAAPAFDHGFKLFYEEDVGPDDARAEVLRLRPRAGRRGVRVSDAALARAARRARRGAGRLRPACPGERGAGRDARARRR